MFDFIRNLTKSAEEKRLETLNAYLDGELSAREQRRFEQEIEQDAALRAEMAQLRQVKQGIGQLPRARAPRNFTLDPAVYGRPQPQPAFQLYPALRVATALAAFFFVIAVVLDLATPAGGLGQPLAAVGLQEAPGAAEVEMAEEAMDAEPRAVTRVVEEVVVEGEPIEVTRLVTETVEEEEMAAAEEEAPAAQEEAEMEVEEEVEEMPEEPAEEEAMEAEMASEPDEERTVEPTEEAGAEAEALTAPTEDTAAETGEADDGAEAPAAAAPARATAVAEATEPAEPLPALTSEAPEAEALPAEEPVEDGLPILLIAEIVFGVGLVVLLTATLLIRRNL